MTSNFCDLYSPVHPTSADLTTMSDQLVTGVLTNNTTYERLKCK